MGIFLYRDLLLPPPSLLNPLLPSVSERVPSVTFSVSGMFRISLTGGQEVIFSYRRLPVLCCLCPFPPLQDEF